MKHLENVSDVRAFFHRYDVPTYFVSATPFNLLGMDEWVHDFTFINLIDCFDGKHPHVFVPPETPHPVFESMEEINNYLLRHDDVQRFVKDRAPKDGESRGNAIFLFFDEETEEICEDLGLRVCFPPASLRTRLDDKLMTTRIADEAGVPSAPNALAPVRGYDDLTSIAREHGLGERLVIQTAFGDSGHTTFFIENEEEYDEHAEEIEAEDEVKIMKRLRVRGSALEACVTRSGTLVGPLMTELVGFEELTPYKGGWCGNEVVADVFPKAVRKFARESAVKIGEALEDLDYRGYFELDFLTDLDTGEVYLGEMNPRITGASSMTNLAAFAHADAPLFLFHLLEYADVPFDLNIGKLNKRWSRNAFVDSWSQLVMKHTGEDIEPIEAAPRSGVWELIEGGGVRFVRDQTHRRTVRSENRAFFLRIAKEGDWFYEGADLGILVTRGRLMNEDFSLTERAKAWISGIRGQYRAGHSSDADRTGVADKVEAAGFKLL